MNDTDILAKALLDVVIHARPAFPRTPYRQALDRAKALLYDLSYLERIKRDDGRVIYRVPGSEQTL